jgi:PAS domain-containing protein
VPVDDTAAAKPTTIHAIRPPEAQPEYAPTFTSSARQETIARLQRVEPLQGRVRTVQQQPESRLEQALANERTRLQLALEAARIGTWDWDANRDLATWSARFAEIHGLPPGRCLGTLADALREVLPVDRASVQRELDLARNSEAPYCAQYRIQGGDGRIRWVQAWGRVFAKDGGGRSRLHGVCLDISDAKWVDRHKDSHHDERHLIERAEPVLEEITSVIGELSPPASDQLAGGLRKLQTIVRQVKSIHQTVGYDFRQPGREVGSPIGEKLARCDVAARAWFQEAAWLINDSVIEVCSNYQLGIEPFWANPGGVMAALWNLQTNAERSIENRNGPPYRITLAAQVRRLHAPRIKAALPDYIVLAVADSGNGIAPEDRARIFQILREDFSSERGRGTQIIRKIMDEHHGLIRLASSEGIGSLVELWFPRLVDPMKRRLEDQWKPYQRIREDVGPVHWIGEDALFKALDPSTTLSRRRRRRQVNDRLACGR